MTLTQEQIQRVCVNAPSARVARVLPALNGCVAVGEIDSPLRAAMFLAQVSHECGDFLWLAEIWGNTPAQRGYEGRKDLGNVEAGDGYRFRGRGIIQITGRRNYREAGAALGLALEEFPDLAALQNNAFKIGAWWWKAHGCNAFADAGDVEGCTRRINGGHNGLMDRAMRYDRAIIALQLARLGVA